MISSPFVLIFDFLSSSYHPPFSLMSEANAEIHKRQRSQISSEKV